MTRILQILALLSILSLCLICFGAEPWSVPELVPSTPPDYALTASWDISPGSSGYELSWGLDPNARHWSMEVGAHTSVSFIPPGGFQYYFAVRAWNYALPASYTNRAKQYSAWSTNVSIVAPCPENEPQLLVWSTNWWVTCQCSNGGYLLTSFDLQHWQTNGVIAQWDVPLMVQGNTAPKQFFKTVTH